MTPVESIDQFITKEVTNHLFEDKKIPFSGMDLPALNVQRGKYAKCIQAKSPLTFELPEIGLGIEDRAAWHRREVVEKHRPGRVWNEEVQVVGAPCTRLAHSVPQRYSSPDQCTSTAHHITKFLRLRNEMGQGRVQSPGEFVDYSRTI